MSKFQSHATKRREGQYLMFCKECGKKLEDSMQFCPYCGAAKDNNAGKTNIVAPSENVTASPQDSRQEARHQQARFIISIVSMVFTFLILFQSCAAGLSNSLEGNLELGGSAGLILCICWWIAGILNISKKKERYAAKSAAVAYAIAGVIGLLLAGSFSDLKIYSAASIIFAVTCYLSSKPKA